MVCSIPLENFRKPQTYSSFSIPTENFRSICNSSSQTPLDKFFARLATSTNQNGGQCSMCKLIFTILLSLDIIALVSLKDIIHFELFNFFN